MKKNLFVFCLLLFITSCYNKDKSEFLETFYTQLLERNGDHTEIYSTLKENATPDLLDFLRDSYADMGYERTEEDGDAFGLWEFVPEFQQDNGNGESKPEKVTALSEDWYKVEYLEQGEKGFMYIKFAECDGELKMDRISKEEPVFEQKNEEQSKGDDEKLSDVIVDFKNYIARQDASYSYFDVRSEYPIQVLVFSPSEENDDFGIATRTRFRSDMKAYNKYNYRYYYSIEGDMLILYDGVGGYLNEGHVERTGDLRFKIHRTSGRIKLSGMFAENYVDFNKFDGISDKYEYLWVRSR